MHRRVDERETSGIPARADDDAGLFAPHECAELAPSADHAAKGLPVLPRLGAIERMQVQQEMRKLRRRQYGLLDAAQCADEVRLHAGIETLQRARDRESGIEMSSRPATGEEDSRARRDQAHSLARTKGSVAPLPMTRSFSLPMFTRMPVISIVSTMLDRP